MKAVRVWGFPSNKGGVNYFYIKEKDIVLEIGCPDDAEEVNVEMIPKIDFLKSVKTQSDYSIIKSCIDNFEENNRL